MTIQTAKALNKNHIIHQKFGNLGNMRRTFFTHPFLNPKINIPTYKAHERYLFDFMFINFPSSE